MPKTTRFFILLVSVLGALVSISLLLLGRAAANGGVPFGAGSVISTTATAPNSVYAADMDSDDDMDVLSASAVDNKIAWYESDGASPPNFTDHVITTNAEFARAVYAADVDGDDDMDVLSASELDDKIAWYENDGASPPNFTDHVITTNADGAYDVHAADVDGDDDMDVLSASRWDDKIAWYENDGTSPPNFTDHVITTNADRAESVYAANVDSDDDLDILSASVSDDKIAWYESDGASPPAFTDHVITTNADAARSVYAVDVDGDDDMDVLSASLSKITWYENDGTFSPAFADHVITNTVDRAWSVYAVDVDGDGDMDVLSASYNDNKIAWYENDGGSPPAFTSHIITTDANGAHSVYAADVDGDGDMDVLSASVTDDKIVWYENQGGTSHATYLPLVMKGHCGCGPDNYEPNNSFAQAYGPLTSGPTYQSYISCCDVASRRDYFYIDLSTTNTINIDLTHIPAGVDYDLYLYNSAQVRLDQSQQDGNLPEHISHHPTSPGRYYILVFSPYSHYSPSPYSLRVTYD